MYSVDLNDDDTVTMTMPVSVAKKVAFLVGNTADTTAMSEAERLFHLFNMMAARGLADGEFSIDFNYDEEDGFGTVLLETLV